MSGVMSAKMTAEEWEERRAWVRTVHPSPPNWEKWNNAGPEKSVGVDCSSGWERIGRERCSGL